MRSNAKKTRANSVAPGEAPFYIPATGAPSRPRLTLKHNDTFAVFDSYQTRLGSVLTAADLRGQAEAAVGLLRRAARAGHLVPGKLRVDSDLDPLRRRDDFRLLMMDLAFPAEPFAQTR